jgi:hypothetical protein
VDDIILVHPGQEHEPGWLGGQLRGQVGWFPEAYAERVSWGLTLINMAPLHKIAMLEDI